MIQERISTLDEAVDMAGFFFQETVNPLPEQLVAKDLTVQQSKEVAEKCLVVLEKMDQMTPAVVEPPMRALVEELGLTAGQVFGIMRVAITGQKVSPPLFESMAIIGKEKTIERMKVAIEMLSKMTG